MRLKKFISAIAALSLLCVASGCVNQHPEQTSGGIASGNNVRIIATSPATADICDRLELDLVGVCSSTLSVIPERYNDVKQIGTAMSPDLEILKSLNPDYVLSPSTLQSDLQPKYASIGVNSIFLNLKSVEGMYASLEGLGEKFDRKEQARILIDEYGAFMEEYRDKNKGKEAPRVLVLMGLPGSYIVATENSYVGSLMRALTRNFLTQILKICRQKTLISYSVRRTLCLMTWLKCLMKNLPQTTYGNTSVQSKRVGYTICLMINSV